MHNLDRDFLLKHRFQEDTDNKMLKELFTNNKRLKEFTHAFTEIQKSARGQRNTVINISIGEKTTDGFLSYLSSSVKNPRILFESDCQRNKRIPQIIISDRVYMVACFPLDDVKIMSTQIENDDGSCPFDRYHFVIHIGKFDYDMTMIIYREREDCV